MLGYKTKYSNKKNRTYHKVKNYQGVCNDFKRINKKSTISQIRIY